MKKILISLSLLLTLGLTASAALPKEGVYLDKEGSPITEEQMVPPSVKSADWPSGRITRVERDCPVRAFQRHRVLSGLMAMIS